MFRSINPATEEVLQEYAPHSAAAVQANLNLAAEGCVVRSARRGAT